MTVTVSLTHFLPMVLPHVPECPPSIATFNLRLAAIEFCERTLCWRHMATVAISRDGRALSAPPYAAIHRIESAVFNGETKLEPIQFSDVDEKTFENTAGTPPRYITQAQYNTVRILPFTEGTLSLSLFLKPVNGSEMEADCDGIVSDAYDVVPEFIYKMHAEQIAAGALARLLAQPGKPWSDMNAALLYGQRFNALMDQHFSVSLTGQQRARRRTRYNDF
jgi:hypothetical protein